MYDKEYSKQYRLTHKDKIKKYTKQYDLDNKEKKKAYNKKYYNTPKMKEYFKQWNLNNKDKRNEQSKKFREKNKEMYLLFKYKQRDKNKNLTCNLTVDWIKENITSKSCIYCKKEDDIGCDRIDNSIGHTINNVLPSCKICNVIRGFCEFTVEEMKILGESKRQIIENRILKSPN